MSFRFIHTSDWHIGRKFSRFSDVSLSARLSDARLEMIERIARIADDQNATHVVCAGDTFHSSDVPRPLVQQTCARLSAAPHVTWHFLPGNHDPAEAVHLWDQIRAVPNAVVHAEATPHELSSDILLLPTPLKTRFSEVASLDWMGDVERPEGASLIALAHGAVSDFGDAEAAMRDTIDTSIVASARLSYMALGDWHGVKCILDRCWYSGTPEVESWKQNGAGSVLAVEVTDAKTAPTVTPIQCTKFDWVSIDTPIRGSDSVSDIDRAIDDARVSKVNLLIRLSLTGTVTADDRAIVMNYLDHLADVVPYLDSDVSGLRARITDGDLERLSHRPGLPAVAGKLRAIAADETHADHPHAEDALMRLMQIAKELEDEHGAPGAGAAETGTRGRS